MMEVVYLIIDINDREKKNKQKKTYPPAKLVFSWAKFSVFIKCTGKLWLKYYLVLPSVYVQLWLFTLYEKNPTYGRHWVSQRMQIIALCKKKNSQLFSGSDLKHLPIFKALCGDNPWVEHLPRVDNPQVQSVTTPYF